MSQMHVVECTLQVACLDQFVCQSCICLPGHDNGIFLRVFPSTVLMSFARVFLFIFSRTRFPLSSIRVGVWLKCDRSDFVVAP